MPSTVKTIGILGAGKVGIVLAQLALKAGYIVYISGSGDPAKIALTIKVLAPGAIAVSNRESIIHSDLIILALPLSKYKTIPTDELKGKLVIDSMNHWYEVDGPREDTVDPNISSSELIRAYLKNARVVKALSHMGYHELHDNPMPPNTNERKAIALAGDNTNDVTVVSDFINTLGFDPLPIGELANGRKLEPGMPAFGANLPKDQLEKLINS